MKIQFGIIGYGRMAEIAHQKIINSFPETQVVAVYDTTPIRRKEAEKQGMRAYDSLKKFLNHPQMNAVAVVTPSVSHHDIVIQCLNAGKDVIVEKPMSMNARETQRMIDSAKRNKRILTIFHNRRYDGDYLAIKKVIQSGKLGRILAIESRINGWGSAAGFGIPTFYQNWRNEKKWGGGGLYDWGSHLIDQMLNMVDSPVKSVNANLQTGIFAKDCDDYAMGMIHFKNGICGIIEVNYMTKASLPRWRVIGEKGTLVSDIKDWNKIYLHDPKKKNPTIIPLVKGDANIIYKTMIQKIQGKGKLVVEPSSVLKTMQVIDAFFESSRKNQSVRLG